MTDISNSSLSHHGAEHVAGACFARVLVVEDDLIIAMTVSELLAERGYVIVGPAATLAEALSLAGKARIDAALVDLNLNGRFAGEVADVLIKRKIPFFFVTGYSQVPDGRYTSIPTLGKPFTDADLQRALDNMLGPTAAWRL